MKTLLTILVITLFNSCILFVAGSYPYREKYPIDSSRDHLHLAIVNLKKEYPEFKAHFRDDDFRVSKTWYRFYFELAEEDLVFHTIIRRNFDNIHSSISFYEYSTLSDPNRSFTVNRDPKRKENKRLIKLFENKVIEPLKTQLKMLEGH